MGGPRLNFCHIGFSYCHIGVCIPIPEPPRFSSSPLIAFGFHRVLEWSVQRAVEICTTASLLSEASGQLRCQPCNKLRILPAIAQPVFSASSAKRGLPTAGNKFVFEFAIR